MSAHHAVRAPFEGAPSGGGDASGSGTTAAEQLGGSGEPKWWTPEDLKKRERAGNGGTSVVGGTAAAGGGFARGGQGHARPTGTNPNANFSSAPYPIQSSPNPPPARQFGPSFVDQGFVPSGLYLSPNASTFTPLGPTTFTPLGPMPPHPVAPAPDQPSAPSSSCFYINHEEYRGQEEDLHVQPDGSYAAFPAPRLAHKIVLSWSASEGGSTAGGDVRGEPEGMLSAAEKERIFAEAKQKKGSRAVEIKRPPPRVPSAPPSVDKAERPIADIKKSASPTPSNNVSTFTFSPQVANFRPRTSLSDPASTADPPPPAPSAAKLATDPPSSPPSTADSTRASPTFGLLKSLKAPSSSAVSLAGSSAASLTRSSVASLVPYGDSDEESSGGSESDDYATPPTISKTPTSVRAKSPEPQEEMQRSSAPSPPSTASSEAKKERSPSSEGVESKQDGAGEDESVEVDSAMPARSSTDEEDEAANTTEELIVFAAEVRVEADGASSGTSASKASASSEEPPTKRVRTEQAKDAASDKAVDKAEVRSNSSCVRRTKKLTAWSQTQTLYTSSATTVDVRPDALVHAPRANAPFSPPPLGKTGNWESFPSFHLTSSPFTRSPLNPSVSPFNPSTAAPFVPGLAWSNGSFSVPPHFGPVPPPNAQQETGLRTVEGLLKDTMEENGVLRRKVEKFKVAHKDQAEKLAAKDAELESARKELVDKLAAATAGLEQARRSSPSSVSVARYNSEETKRALLEQRKEMLAEKEAAVKKVQLLLDIETKRAQSLRDAIQMRDDQLRAKDDALRSIDDRIKKSEQRADNAVRAARAAEKQYREDFERRLRTEEAERRKEVETRMVVEKKALEAKIKSLEEKLEAGEEELLQASASVELMKGKKEDATSELKALSAELKEMVASRDAALADAKKVKDELSQAHAAIADWRRCAEEKANEATTVSAELLEMVVARDAALARWRDVKNELDMRCRELDEAREASEKAQEAETQATLALASTKTTLKEKEAELATAEEHRDDAIRDILALEHAMTLPSEALLAANKTCDDLRTAKQSLEERVASLDKELSTHKTEAETFRNKALKEIKRLTTQVKEAQESQTRLSKLERDLADAQQKVEGAEIAQKQVKLELDETKGKLEAEQNARTALEGLFRQKNEYKEAELKRVQERAKSEQDELRQRVQRLEEEVVKAEQTHEEAAQHLDAVLAQCTDLKQDKDKLERRVAELEQNKAGNAAKALTDDAQGARRTEAASDKASTSSVVHAAFARRPVTSKTLELLAKTTRKA
ncbi:hypothetical protein NBRC10513v2_007690 [Rhodotorula toruloides]